MASDWIKGAIKKPGALRKQLGVKPGKTIPMSKLNQISSDLAKKSEGTKKLTADERTLSRRVSLAKTLRKMNK